METTARIPKKMPIKIIMRATATLSSTICSPEMMPLSELGPKIQKQENSKITVLHKSEVAEGKKKNN